MKLEIHKYQDPVLRKKAEKIKDPLSQDVQKLIADMFETMHLNDGVGLAAPQVGQSLRLCVLDVEGKKYVLINPTITAKSKMKITSDEGCLSFPGEFYQIKRYADVQVRFLDKKGKPAKIKASGLLARALQHEIDHLDGVLFIDKVKKRKTIIENK